MAKIVNLIPYPKKEEYRADNARKVNSKKFPNSYLYILNIENTPHYKIGVSNKPRRRIKDIRASIPYIVNVLYIQKHKNTYELEEMIHDNFKEKELIHEWFNLNNHDVSTILNTLKDFEEEGIYLTRIETQTQLSL